MATLGTTLNPISFPHEVDQLVVSASGDFNFGLLLDDAVLLSARLTPGPSGRCVIPDLAQLILDHIPSDTDGAKFKTYRLSVRLDGADVAHSLILPCRVRIDESAIDFIGQSFLTVSGFRKYTHAQAAEYLFAYYDQNSRLTEKDHILSKWFDATTRQVYNNEQPLEQGTTITYDNGSSFGLDVSPHNILAPTPSAHLLTYTVYAAGRTQTYTLFPAFVPSHLKDFTFINAFGVLDTFHCFGMVQREMKIDYHAAVIHSKMNNYLVQATPSWKVKTGPMYDEQRMQFEDLCTSLNVKSAEGVPLTVTDCEMKDTDNWAGQPEGSITYRESVDYLRNRISHPVQTFDKSFDKTFE